MIPIVTNQPPKKMAANITKIATKIKPVFFIIKNFKLLMANIH